MRSALARLSEKLVAAARVLDDDVTVAVTSWSPRAARTLQKLAIRCGICLRNPILQTMLRLLVCGWNAQLATGTSERNRLLPPAVPIGNASAVWRQQGRLQRKSKLLRRRAMQQSQRTLSSSRVLAS